MTSDIDNWVKFLNETVSKVELDKNVKFNEKSVIRDLKLTALPMLIEFIGNTKGRSLSSLLKNLEKSFLLLTKKLKKEKDIDDVKKLSFLALSNVVIEILREMRIAVYSKGKDFDSVTFLNEYKDKLVKESKLKEKPKDVELIEDDSEEEFSDEDSEYLNVSDMEEEYSEPVEGKKRKRNYVIVVGKSKDKDVRESKKSKLDLDFANSLNTSLAPVSYEERAISYFKKFEEEEKEQFLNKFKTITESTNNSEPILFKIVNMNLPVEQKNNILSDYMNIENSMSDKSKLRNWLENLLKIPFGKKKGIELENIKTTDEIKNFIKTLQNTMNSAVFGHDEAKNKIIEIMAQYITNPESKGNCIGLWGPPGNGKTTLIKEGIAKAMNRSFVFISLGGASDSSFLEGHSYTYEGSIYGRIAQGLMKSECMNPIIYFDELDKISNTHKGQEIINLLVHITDPIQNSEFVDKYFYNVKLNLSKATFIFSYNDPSLIDPVLRDRITQIETKYLLTNQKINIAQNYLLPSILTDMGASKNDFIISNSLLENIITKYTLEGGVRKLKAILYSIIRQLNIMVLTQTKLNDKIVTFPFTIRAKHLNTLMKDYSCIEHDKINKTSEVGVINGMFASSLGIGGVLPIESKWIPAERKNFIKKTGSLQNVIKESIDVAHTLAWSYVDDSIKDEYEKKFKDRPEGIHLHCPDGATPKDGPSAGTALTVLFYSRFMNKKIRNDIAITGEINLQGSVLKIGGLEEKLQGAKRAGVKLALIPKSNLTDLEKINIRNPNLLDNSFNVIDVERIEDVFQHVFF